jgi:hypothetical protein
VGAAAAHAVFVNLLVYFTVPCRDSQNDAPPAIAWLQG